MYTWGYLKEASVTKLDMDIEEARSMGIEGKFYLYANEVITQVCSSVKPKRTYYEIIVDKNNVNKILSIEDADFISFSDAKCTVETNTCYGNKLVEECHDDVFEYLGYNQFICKSQGKFRIGYNKRWFTFGPDTLDEEVLPVPADVLECIPSYIAHQYLKSDDEYKSAVFRNEYEMFVSRIDDTDYDNTRTFKIEGDW